MVFVDTSFPLSAASTAIAEYSLRLIICGTEMHNASCLVFGRGKAYFCQGKNHM